MRLVGGCSLPLRRRHIMTVTYWRDPDNLKRVRQSSIDTKSNTESLIHSPTSPTRKAYHTNLGLHRRSWELRPQSSELLASAFTSTMLAAPLSILLTQKPLPTDSNPYTDYSPITYSHPSPPIQTSCTFPAGTSILAPTPNVCFVGFSSRGYVMVSVPRRMRWVLRPLWEWGA